MKSRMEALQRCPRRARGDATKGVNLGAGESYRDARRALRGIGVGNASDFCFAEARAEIQVLTNCCAGCEAGFCMGGGFWWEICMRGRRGGICMGGRRGGPFYYERVIAGRSLAVCEGRARGAWWAGRTPTYGVCGQGGVLYWTLPAQGTRARRDPRIQAVVVWVQGGRGVLCRHASFPPNRWSGELPTVNNPNSHGILISVELRCPPPCDGALFWGGGDGPSNSSQDTEAPKMEWARMPSSSKLAD